MKSIENQVKTFTAFSSLPSIKFEYEKSNECIRHRKVTGLKKSSGAVNEEVETLISITKNFCKRVSFFTQRIDTLVKKIIYVG